MKRWTSKLTNHLKGQPVSTIHIKASDRKNPAPTVNLEPSAIADLAKWAAAPPLLARGRVTAIFGPKSTGKSASALFIAHATTVDDTSFGDLGKGPVLYFTNEGAGGVPKRLTALAKMYGPRPEDSLHMVFGLNDYRANGRALDRIKAIVRQCEPSLVIVDGAVTTFGDDAEGAGRRWADAARAIAKLGPAVLVTILDYEADWFDADFDEQVRLERAEDDPCVYGTTRNGTLLLSFELAPATLSIDSDGDPCTAVYAKDVLVDGSDYDPDDWDWLSRPYVLSSKGRN
ncbi:MAG: hypothetical protein EOR60_03125 [Mesorhizobium sp.]|nr:MAG: hypothetical protein EOR60_03125 [Mesorhizobium sp.]